MYQNIIRRQPGATAGLGAGLAMALLGAVVVLANAPGPDIHLAAPLSLATLAWRLALIPVLLLACYGLGAATAKCLGGGDTAKWPVPFVLFLGFLAVTLGVYLLSLVSMLTYPVVNSCFLLSLALTATRQGEFAGRIWGGCLRFARSCRKPWSFTGVLSLWAGAILLVTIAVVLSFKTLYPDYGGDYFYYIGYYHDLLRKASIFTKSYDAFVFFPAKASGLHTLCAVLFGVDNLPLASGVYFIFFSSICFCFFRLFTAELIWPALTIFVSAMNTEMIIFTNNFAKSNYFSSLHVCFLLYALLYLAKYGENRRSKIIFGAYGLSVSFFTLQGVVFSLALLGVASLFLRITGRKCGRMLLWAAGSLLAGSAVLSLANYLTVGFFDIATAAPQLRLGLAPSWQYLPCQERFKILELGLMPAGPAGLWNYLGHVWELVASKGFLGSKFLDVAWLALAASLLVFLKDWKRSAPRRLMAFFLAMAVSLVLMHASFCGIFSDDYTRKHSIFAFGVLIKIWVYVFSFYLFLAGPLVRIARKSGLSWRALVTVKNVSLLLVSLALVLTAVKGNPYNFQDDFRERLEFLQGRFAPKEVYIRYYPEVRVCDAALAYLEKEGLDGLVLPMGYSPPTKGYSNGRFAGLIDQKLQPFLKEIFYSDPQIAVKRLRELGMPFVFFDLDDEPRYLDMAPLFDPVFARNNFRVLARVGRDAWLLTVDPGLGTAMDDELAERFKGYVKRGRDEGAMRIYNALGKFLEKCQ